MDIPFLLSRISIPPFAKIHIQCNEAPDPVICFSQMFPPGHSFLAELPKYGTLKHLHSFTYFHFRLIDEATGGSLSFRVHRYDQATQTDASILDFFREFGESAQHVEVYPPEDSENSWVEILQTLPNLQFIEIKRERDYAGLIAALSTRTCPKLKKLSIEYYAYKADHHTTWLAHLKSLAESGVKLEEFNLAFTEGAGLPDDVADEFRLYTDKFSHKRRS